MFIHLHDYVHLGSLYEATMSTRLHTARQVNAAHW